MSNMISVASGFQYSVNIGYDLNNDDKLKNFIPTKSALSLLEDILLSTNTNSTNRARVLIGAYGKGKSHIVLMILSMLMKKDIGLFAKILPLLEENPRLNQCIQNYYDSENRAESSLPKLNVGRKIESEKKTCYGSGKVADGLLFLYAEIEDELCENRTCNASEDEKERLDSEKNDSRDRCGDHCDADIKHNVIGGNAAVNMRSGSCGKLFHHGYLLILTAWSARTA